MPSALLSIFQFLARFHSARFSKCIIYCQLTRLFRWTISINHPECIEYHHCVVGLPRKTGNIIYLFFSQITLHSSSATTKMPTARHK